MPTSIGQTIGVLRSYLAQLLVLSCTSCRLVYRSALFFFFSLLFCTVKENYKKIFRKIIVVCITCNSTKQISPQKFSGVSTLFYRKKKKKTTTIHNFEYKTNFTIQHSIKNQHTPQFTIH